MSDPLKHLFPAFLLWLPLGFATSSAAESSCGDCYRIDTPTLVGVVVGDVFLTVIIMLVVYHCTKQSFQRRQNDGDKKVYMNMPIR